MNELHVLKITGQKMLIRPAYVDNYCMVIRKYKASCAKGRWKATVTSNKKGRNSINK